MSFTHFDLEGALPEPPIKLLGCPDHVLLTGMGQDGVADVQYCGKGLPPDYITSPSMDGHLLVAFYSGPSVTGGGFSATVTFL